MGEDHKQAVDDKEEEVKAQDGPEKQEVREHPGSETPAQSLHGRMPQLEGTEEIEAAEHAVTPSLMGGKHE